MTTESLSRLIPVTLLTGFHVDAQLPVVHQPDVRPALPVPPDLLAVRRRSLANAWGLRNR